MSGGPLAREVVVAPGVGVIIIVISESLRHIIPVPVLKFSRGCRPLAFRRRKNGSENKAAHGYQQY